MRAPSDSQPLSLPDLDPEETYVGELVAIDERPYTGPTRYREDGSEAKNTNSVIWKFKLTDPNGVLVTTPEGADYTLWAWSSDSTFLDTKGGGRTARARQYMHALSGRELDDQEVERLLVSTDGKPTLPTALIGKRVRIDVVLSTASDGRQRWQVERMRPMPREQQPVQPVRVPARAAAAALEDLPF